MTLGTLSFVLGSVLLVAGLLGGGVEAKEIKIPKISGVIRIVAAVLGFAFIALAFFPPSHTPSLLNPGGAKMSAIELDTDRHAMAQLSGRYVFDDITQTVSSR